MRAHDESQLWELYCKLLTGYHAAALWGARARAAAAGAAAAVWVGGRYEPATPIRWPRAQRCPGFRLRVVRARRRRQGHRRRAPRWQPLRLSEAAAHKGAHLQDDTDDDEATTTTTLTMNVPAWQIMVIQTMRQIIWHFEAHDDGDDDDDVRDNDDDDDDGDDDHDESYFCSFASML